MRTFLTAVLLCCLTAAAQGAEPTGLDSLYLVIDRAIDSSAVYLQRKTDRINELKRHLGEADTDAERFEQAKSVYQEYVPFDNDSALAYQYLCLDLAERLQRSDLRDETRIALARQLTESGFYNEARIHFAEVTPPSLSTEALTAYLDGLNHLYGEMGFYSHDPRLKYDFFNLSGQYGDSLLARLDTLSGEWLQLRTMDLINQKRLDEAQRYCDRWQRTCEPDSRPWAIMAYYRSLIYGQQGDRDRQRYWLAQSALVDIRNAIMDQGALWSLAESLMSDAEELDRANRYINFSWQCLSRFSTHMRSWLVAPVVTRINDEYKDQLRAANQQLRWTLVLISLLAVGLLALLFYVQKKRRQLALAQQELASLNGQLASKNDELQQANTLLSDTNQLISDTNEQLRLAVLRQNDSNRVKDEYIGKFLSICSEYIDKLDGYRIKVNRKLKANQYADLLRMTGSEQLKQDEVRELFDNFDTVFLHLFPTFIDEFNALLRPEERIVPSGKGQLNTDLRIFALIRLGIDESSKIAEFLRYSPNSIYAYRARIKNKAAGNRSDFERQVKEIGIHG